MSQDGATELLPPHVSADFYLWLWYRSEIQNGKFTLDDGSALEVYLDDRLALREIGDDRPAVMRAQERPPRVSCTVGENMWRDRWGR